MNNHYLEVAEDENKCKCPLAVRLLGEGCRYCNPQEYIDKMSEWLDEERKNLSEANARIAMKDEALIEAEGSTAYASHDDSVGYRVCCDVRSYLPHSKDCTLMKAISASPESVAAWEESKLLPLRRQVAMLHKSLRVMIDNTEADCDESEAAHRQARDSINNTQATAEAYDKAHAAKVLEELADYLDDLIDYEQYTNAQSNALRDKAAELRAEAQKGS